MIDITIPLFEEFLKETPDTIFKTVGSFKSNYTSPCARSFLIFNNIIFYVINENTADTTHYTMRRYIKNILRDLNITTVSHFAEALLKTYPDCSMKTNGIKSQDQFDLFKYEHMSHMSHLNTINGRLFLNPFKDGKSILTFWAKVDIVKPYKTLLQQMLKYFGLHEEQCLYQLSDQEDNEYFTYYQFYNLPVPSSKPEWQQKIDREKHLMNPILKQAVKNVNTTIGFDRPVDARLNFMRTIGDSVETPKFNRYLMIQENIVRPFLKFYHAFSRGSLPDKEIVIECLMILEQYYREYLEWYSDHPERILGYEQVYEDFTRQYKNIQRSIKSEMLTHMIAAVDTGINQWHHDYPVIAHLGMEVKFGDKEDISDKEYNTAEGIAGKVYDILVGLGRLPKESPYIPKKKSDSQV